MTHVIYPGQHYLLTLRLERPVARDVLDRYLREHFATYLVELEDPSLAGAAFAARAVPAIRSVATATPAFVARPVVAATPIRGAAALRVRVPEAPAPPVRSAAAMRVKVPEGPPVATPTLPFGQAKAKVQSAAAMRVKVDASPGAPGSPPGAPSAAPGSFDAAPPEGGGGGSPGGGGGSPGGVPGEHAGPPDAGPSAPPAPAGPSPSGEPEAQSAPTSPEPPSSSYATPALERDSFAEGAPGYFYLRYPEGDLSTSGCACAGGEKPIRFIGSPFRALALDDSALGSWAPPVALNLDASVAPGLSTLTGNLKQGVAYTARLVSPSGASNTAALLLRKLGAEPLVRPIRVRTGVRLNGGGGKGLDEWIAIFVWKRRSFSLDAIPQPLRLGPFVIEDLKPQEGAHG